MRNNFICFLILFFSQELFSSEKIPNVVLAVHGGSSDHYEITKELEESYKEGIRDALNAGYSKLTLSGSSLDAVETAVNSLENNPLGARM